MSIHWTAGLLLALSAAVQAAPSAEQLLDRARQAAGGAAWERPAALQAVGRVVASGMTGRWTRTDDLRTGRNVVTYDMGVHRTAEGDDGRGRWRQDPSGGVHPLDSAFARQAAATEAWLARWGWLRAGRGEAQLGEVAQRHDGGQDFDVVQAVPPRGQPVELWFDAAHRLARTVRVMPISTVTVRYSDYRRVGALRLPFVIATEATNGGAEKVSIAHWHALREVADAAFAAPRPPDDTRLAGATTVPIELDPWPVVHALVNGHPMDFILDTGGHNILTPAAAQALGLSGVGQGVSGGAGAGTVNEQYLRVKELRIGEAVMSDQHFYVLPFSYATLERGTRAPLAGLLGLEVFERLRVRIDYRGKTLTLRRLGDDAAPPDQAVALPLFFEDDMPEVEGRIDGRPGVLALDTGNGSSMVIQPVWARAQGLAAQLKRGLETVSYGAGGASTNWASRIERLQLGELAIERPIARYAEDTAGSFSSRTEAANVGTEVLAHFVVEFDYARGQVWLAPQPGYVQPPFNRAGLRATKQGPKSFQVAVVSADSPAAAAGLQRDDEIVAVDGQPAEQLSGRDLARALTQPAGTAVSLTLQRGSERRDVKVTLAELLP